MSRGPSGEKRSVPACANRRQIPSFEAGCLVSDPIDAAMDADQGADRDSTLEFSLGHPGPKYLSAAHDAMGSAGNPAENLFDCPVLCRHRQV